MNRTANDVSYRFDREQEYVERYVQLLQAKSTLHDRQVLDLNRILKRVRCPLLPRRSYDRTTSPYSPKELTDLLAAIKKTNPEVYQTILGYEQRLDDIPSFGFDGPVAQYFDRMHEWVDYFMDRLSDDPEEDDEEGIIRLAFDEAMACDQDADEEDQIPPDALRALLGLAVDHARHAKVQQLRDAMVYAREQFDEIELLARIATPGSEINVLRQGFILLMTAFDAAVFDLTKIAFKKKFFDLVGVFGKQDKVSMETLADAKSFKVFRDQVIEEQLKKRYVKELLGLLKSLGVKLVDDSDKDVQLTELVLRRNLHIHNRGEVDERYLEIDQKSGKPKYNLFGLKLGQVAVIDEPYLVTANRLCKFCVDSLCQWANS